LADTDISTKPIYRPGRYVGLSLLLFLQLIFTVDVWYVTCDFPFDICMKQAGHPSGATVTELVLVFSSKSNFKH